MKGSLRSSTGRQGKPKTVNSLPADAAVFSPPTHFCAQDSLGGEMGECWHGWIATDNWGREIGKASHHNHVFTLMGKAYVLVGRVWGKEEIPGDMQSCESPSHHPCSRPLRRVITSNLDCCMSAGRLQFCGQRQGRAGSAGTCQGVTSPLARSVRAWQQLAITTAAPIIPDSRDMPQPAPHFLTLLPFW